MIYSPDNYHDSVEDTRELQKPASHPSLQFWIPAAGGGNFYNSPERWLDGSIADLCIALDPLESDGSNSLYAVLSNRCGQQPAPSPPQMVSLMELL